MKTAQKKVYWLTDQMTGDHRSKAIALSARGFDVHFFRTIDAIATEIQSERASVIVVSDDGEKSVVERMIFTLMGMPEVAGARLILACRGDEEATATNGNHAASRLQFLAACANFRDFIPMDLDAARWVARFRFATASQAAKVTPPTGQLTAKELVAIHLPARVTWITPTSIRLESRVHPPRGATLSLSGAFAEALGVPSITLTVKDSSKDHLTYRFSDAIVCDWTAPAHVQARIPQVLQSLQEHNTGPRSRIFIAAIDAHLRNQLLSQFEDPRFEVTSALQKNSIVSEPKFFSPELVLIQHTLCIGSERDRFEQMLEQLSDQTHVVVIGHDPEIEQIKKKFPLKRITRIGRMPRNFEQAITKRYLPEIQKDTRAPSDALHISSDSVLSLAEINLSARLRRIHPHHIQIAMPFRIGNFALARLDAPMLWKQVQRKPYIKLTSTFQSSHPQADSFLHLANANFTDLTKDERRRITEGLCELAERQLSPLTGKAS